MSVFAIDLETRERQCVEDMLLYEYRLEAKESTLANHGRCHPKWTRPGNRKSNKIILKVIVKVFLKVILKVVSKLILKISLKII